MATNKNVIVLVPNGRRQNVKVTANSTILQVLEEVCRKHGYNVDDYDVKHFNKVLDSNAILSFIGLPNNAQLEMIPCTKKRLNSNVTIAVQLENGKRLMDEFMPNTTLAEILQHLGLDQDLEKVALIYMHSEIHGINALKNTKLKSLGLNNGKAVLRLMYRDLENTNVAVSTTPDSLKGTDSSTTDQKITISNKTISSSQEKVETLKKIEIGSQIVENKIEKITKLNKEQKVFKAELGDRNALVFNQAAMQPVSRDELPDDFYDLTVDDVKLLLRDVKNYRKELEEAPLLTNAQRQLDQEKRMLNQLNKYYYTIIRIHFPDQFILQGLFQPMETIQAIKDFVKSYLTDANNDFVIFVTPPKRILNPSASLIHENLVPCANVYYSGSSNLKSDVKQKVTDPKTIEKQVAEIRMSMLKQEDQTVKDNVKINSATSGEGNM